MQLADDCVAYLPALQSVHGAGPVVPDAAEKPPSGAYEPAAHGPAQAEDVYAVPAMKYVPAGQAVQAEVVPVPEREYEAVGQVEQLPEDWVANVPALQGVHSAGPFVVVTDCEKPPLGAYEPAAHGPAHALDE